MRLNLIVEGQTEQVFAQQVLRPHLAERQVYLVKPRLTAFSRSKRSVSRGGVRKYVTMRDDMLRWMREDRADDVRFSTMIDLYGLPHDFPAFDEARQAADPYDRVGRLEAAFRADIGDARFIPYLQLHEFEALVLSEPQALASRFCENAAQVTRLAELCASYSSPELIDDGEQTAPSKRIIAQIPEYAGAKKTLGPAVASDIGLSTIRVKCRHFNEWLSLLEGLGSGTGQNLENSMNDR